MLNRDYKEFAKGEIYHVYNRGNNKESIFRDKDDYRAFLFRTGLALGFNLKELSESELLYFPNTRIRINAKPSLFKLHSFCLMPNHFHFLIEQLDETPISEMILRLCTSFSMYFNKKYERVGNVFQDCFKSVHTTTHKQLMWNSAYIHMNPVVANIVKRPEHYEWSSYKDFVENRKLPFVSSDLFPEIFTTKGNMEKETWKIISKDDLSIDAPDTWDD